jgi:hypothetical protein
MLRKLFARGLPEPPDEAPGLGTMIAEALDFKQLAPVRSFWDNLLALQPWWPLLLPLLGWIGWRTYQRERAEVLHRRGVRG